jgi:KAP-like P-loop domain-containing protein
VSFLAGVGQWLWAKMRVHKKPLEGKFAQYVRQPTYEGKLGFFHEVEQDVRRVFKLLVSEKEPVVIFIDDLDRCSPGTVAQVIEAMNLFLSADFPDCYFIVGMDAQVVAASMEVAYENLDRKLKSVTRSYGSLGWYFMDKFIQLQFNIPNMNKEMRNGYLAKLFGHAATSEQKQPTKEELNKIEAEVTATLENKEVKPEDLARTATQVAQLRVERPKVWQIQSRKLIETGAKKLTDDNPELQKYLDDYKDLLGSSPRAIKRFANLFRFYSLTQYARQTQGLEASSPAALARWLVIMLRWPQLVRWIQWESETKLTTETDAKDKAAALEEQLCGTRTFEAWLKHLEEMDPAQGEWLRDKHLYDFLKTPVAIDRKLTIAVQNGVW